MPDHSTFSKNRHGRFRQSDVFRHLLEGVLRRCMSDGLVGDTAYGTAPMLAWMVKDKGIASHVPVWDRIERKDGTLSSSEFVWGEQADDRHTTLKYRHNAPTAPMCSVCG